MKNERDETLAVGRGERTVKPQQEPRKREIPEEENCPQPTKRRRKGTPHKSATH